MSETERRLREIQERAEKATEGPWYAHHCGYHKEDPGSACGIATDPREDFEGYADIVGDRAYDECHHPMTEEDAQFVAHAREDIPFLLQLVKKLQNDNAELLRFPKAND